MIHLTRYIHSNYYLPEIQHNFLSCWARKYHQNLMGIVLFFKFINWWFYKEAMCVPSPLSVAILSTDWACFPKTTFISDKKLGCLCKGALVTGLSSALPMLSTLLDELCCDWNEHVTRHYWSIITIYRAEIELNFGKTSKVKALTSGV